MSREGIEAAKSASQYFELVDKNLLYHASAVHDTDWVFCPVSKEETIQPLLQGLGPPDKDGRYVIAIPHNFPVEKNPAITDLHQVTRELVEGIYVFNQTPSIRLENNQDSSSSCSLPSAYVDTLVGHTLFNLDYYVKSLLHGNIISSREKRAKIGEKWRKTVQDNPSGLHELYTEFGMVPMEEKLEMENMYVDKNVLFPRLPERMVDNALVLEELTLHLSTGEEQAKQLVHLSRDVFLRYLEQASIGLVFSQLSVQQEGNLLVLDPAHNVITQVQSVGRESENEKELLSHLHVYLQKQRDFVRDNLLLPRSNGSQHTQLLHYVSFMVLLLATLKQQNRIVRCDKLRNRMNRDLLATDRELSPFLPSQKSRWSPYASENHYSGCNGGIVFNKQQMLVSQLSSDVQEHSTELVSQALANEKDAVTCTVGGRTYTLLTLHSENFYQNSPKLPRWVHAMISELKNQVRKQSAITDNRVVDLLRRPLGTRQASKLKTLNVALVPCIEKGLTAPVAAMVRRCTRTRISKCNEDGMALIHYAAKYGRAEIASILVHHTADPNQPCQFPDQAPLAQTPVHLASLSGCLDTVGCLLRHGSEWDRPDDNGWTPTHHAAFHNYHHLLSLFGKRDRSSLERETADRQKASPLLLAAHNGSLDSVKCLVDFGVSLTSVDSSERNIVHITTVKSHVPVLQYLTTLDQASLPVWDILCQMLKAEPSSGHPQAGACAIDSLLHWKISYCDELLRLEAIKQLVELLKLPGVGDAMELLSVQVIADVSNVQAVKAALLAASAIPFLIKLLSSTVEHIHSCVCVILCDLALDPVTKQKLAEAGAIPPLIRLLDSPSDEIRLYATACIGILAQENPASQALVRENNGLQALIRLLDSDKLCIQGCSAAALQALLEDCQENQLATLEAGVVPLLVTLLRSSKIPVYCNAAMAVGTLAQDCPQAQQLLQQDSTQCTMLLRRLLKMREPMVKVCGASALWAIAGKLIGNKRHIAGFMGIDTLVDLVLIEDEKLNYVCSEALGVLASELGHNQQRIANLGGLTPLVEVIDPSKRGPTSQRVYISVLHTLGSLLTKPGLVANLQLQKAIADAQGMTLLINLVISSLAETVRVEAACTLAKLVIGNHGNEHKLSQQPSFSHLLFLKFFGSEDPEVRLLTGYALSVYVFNNPRKLSLLTTHCSLHVSNFIHLLNSSSELHQAHAAFQLVVLSKMIVGLRDVEARVHGIKLLVQLCCSKQEQTKVLSSEFLACLARCKEGVPLATVMAGALDPLMDNLHTNSPPIVEAACAAIGYFSYQPLASRLIISRFRTEPELYRVFKRHLPHLSVAKKFLGDWAASEASGLPSLSLRVRGGPDVSKGSRRENTARPTGRRQDHSKMAVLEAGLLTSRKLAMTGQPQHSQPECRSTRRES